MTEDNLLKTLGMSGDYNKHSAPQRMAASHTFPLLEKAVKGISHQMRLGKDEPFVVADYGSSHGGNSMKPINIVVESVRQCYSPNQSIAVYHTDLPHNDYNKLFTGIHETKESYYTQHNRAEAPILSFASATPFFQQILPSNSVHLGYSSCATHYLSGFPCDVQNLYSVEAPPKQREIWREQASQDWDRFLEIRSRELAAGGCLILSNLFADADGDYTTKDLGIVMDSVIEEMCINGMITRQQAGRFCHPSYFRTFEEYISPLHKHNLSLCESFSRHVPNPLYQEFEKSGDWVGFGEAMAEWAKQWVYISLLRVIDGLDDASKEKASNFFYRRVADKISENPHVHSTIMVMLYLMVSKNLVPANARN